MTLDVAFHTHRLYPTEDNLATLIEHVRKAANKALHDEDVAQEIAMHVMKRLHTLVIQQRFSCWLAGVIRHHRFAAIRRRVRDRAAVEVFDETTMEPASAPRSASYRLSCDGIEASLCRAILDGYTVAQAAKSVGISANAARKRLRKLAT
jgi:DNA-directed RNA polymerase specialized sigma24 family protein